MTVDRRHIVAAAVAAVLLLQGGLAARALTRGPVTTEAAWQLFALATSLVATIGLIWTLADQAARHARLADELRLMVNRDRLTDVATRDGFFDRLEEKAAERGVSLMIDIDHFKKVNDTYGHLAGDTVIRRVARLLRENCRKEDTICRFGGEEFVIFLPGMSVDHGQIVAERLRRQVSEAVVMYGDAVIRVTVSIGVAEKTAQDSIDQVIQTADEALYRAKRDGRNRITLGPPSGERLSDSGGEARFKAIGLT
jgi:diguanylate cyclase (GGDEF)-like protein